MKKDITLKLLSPLMHYGDERMGTMQIARCMKFEYDGEFIDIPVYSGNAFRGIMRRIAMRDFLEKIGIAEEGISPKLYYLLFTGGTLTGGGRFCEIGEKREMRRLCPPLSLFGSAIGDQIPEGKMKVGIFKPICKETEDYTGKHSDISFYDMLEEIFYTRRDDLKSTNCDLIQDSEDKKDKKENPVQMKYDMQALSAGAKLISSIIIENSNDIEESCLESIIEKFKEMPYIGGKSATGHGEVEITYEGNKDSNLYYDYLEQNKEEIRNWLRDLEGKL
ncbi:MAG: hypothetical protein ACLUTP_06040 [Terrisporobacter sp.]|uniref:hypothetical protein n=1 Tax=Terrisporobacter sp. TaxID=1965305 RepID=UPI00399B3125